ncbi:hypothetical protein V8E53_005819 [Lactarius tabidus]
MRKSKNGQYSTWSTSPPGICKLAMHQSKNDSVNARVNSHRKGKGRVGDIWGSKELMYVLKNVFENNWYGPGSRNMAFAYDLTNPKVVASVSCYRVADKTPLLSLACHAESNVTHCGDHSEEHKEQDDSDDEVVVDVHRNPIPSLQPKPVPRCSSLAAPCVNPTTSLAGIHIRAYTHADALARRQLARWHVTCNSTSASSQGGRARTTQSGLQRKVTAVQPVSTLCHVAQRNFICHAIPADGSLDVQTDNSGLHEWAKLLGFLKDEGGRDGRVVHSYENSRLLTRTCIDGNVRHAVGGGSEMDKDIWAAVGEMGRVLYGSRGGGSSIMPWLLANPKPDGAPIAPNYSQTE